MDEKVLEPAATPLSAGTRRRSVTAVGAGNLLEWYDFAIYASLASVLAQLFFTSGDALVALLATFSVFAVGYLARPIGAVVFGRLSDRRGRKVALVAVITLMGAATTLIGVLPTYASIGVAAPILLCLARLTQGLSIGGEFSTSVTYLVEIAPPGRRGLYGSVVYFTATLGFALGLGLVFLLNTTLGPEAMAAWGWRVPFLLSFPLLLIGMYLRSRTHETPAFTRLVDDGRVEGSPLRTTLRNDWRPMVRLVGMIVVFSVSSYTVLAFVLSFLLVVLKQPAPAVFPSVLVATVVGALLVPPAGALSDRFGRRPLLLAGCALCAVVAVPAYLLLLAGGFVATTLGQILIWIPVALFSGVFPVTLSEMFPTGRRTTAIGLPVGVATAVFSGTTPLVATALIGWTGSPMAPAFYLVAAAVVSTAFLWGLRETAGSRLADA